MKEKNDDEYETHMRHGWWCSEKRHGMGFGLWVGLFFVLWSGSEILKYMGIIKFDFPVFWAFLFLLGLSMIIKRFI